MSPIDARMPPAGPSASPVHGCRTRPDLLLPMTAPGSSSSGSEGV